MVILPHANEFNDLLVNIRGQRGKARIAVRPVSPQLGHFVEYRVLDEGVCGRKE